MNAKKVNLNLRLNTLFTRLGLTTNAKIKEYMVGKSIIPVVNNFGGQTSYPLNEPIEIDEMTSCHNGNNGSCVGMAMSSGYAGNTHVYWSECILAPDNKVSITKELDGWAKREKDIKLQKNLLVEKLAY